MENKVKESPAVEKKEQEVEKGTMKATPVKEMPKRPAVEAKATQPAPPPQPTEFYFTPEGVEEINNYLALANQAEVNGILEYKSAFHRMVELVRGNLKVK